MHQPTFASAEFEQKKRKTRRERFLGRMEAMVAIPAARVVGSP